MRSSNRLVVEYNSQSQPTPMTSCISSQHKKGQEETSLVSSPKRSFGTQVNWIPVSASKSPSVRETAISFVDSGVEPGAYSEKENREDSVGTSNAKENSEEKKRRRERTTFTKSQLNALQNIFKTTKYPDVALRDHLSKQTMIPESRIQVWFKNRRAKCRKENSKLNYPSHSSREAEFCSAQKISYQGCVSEDGNNSQLARSVHSNRLMYEEPHFQTQSGQQMSFPLDQNVLVPGPWVAPYYQQQTPFSQQQSLDHGFSQSFSYAQVQANQLQNLQQGYALGNAPNPSQSVGNAYFINPFVYQSHVRYYGTFGRHVPNMNMQDPNM